MVPETYDERAAHQAEFKRRNRPWENGSKSIPIVLVMQGVPKKTTYPCVHAMDAAHFISELT